MTPATVTYIASVLYHDSFWHPFNAERPIHDGPGSPWGRLFQNREQRADNADGFPPVGIRGARLADAPAFASRPRRQTPRPAA